MRSAVVIAVLAGCTQPAPPPSYYTNNPHRSGTQRVPTQEQVGLLGSVGQPADPYASGGSATPGVTGTPSAAQLACGTTMVCYTKCNPVTDQCLDRCDASAHEAGAAAGARQILACMLDNGCKDEGCLRRSCTAEIQACFGVNIPGQVAGPAPAPAPAPAPPTPAVAVAGIDLSFQTPAGWSQAQLVPGALTLQKVAPGIEYRIHVFPSQPRTGAIGELFRTTWAAMVGPGFETTGAHGPYRRRLASGYPLAFDAAQLAIKGSTRTTTVGIYLLYTKDRVVTMLATGLDGDAEAAAAKFFDALTIKGAPATPGPLFDPAELAGTWTAGADRLTLEPTGRFTTSRKMSGTWKLDDDTLTLDTRGKKDTRRLCGRGPAPVGGGDALCIDRDGRPAFVQPSGTWYAGS